MITTEILKFILSKKISSTQIIIISFALFWLLFKITPDINFIQNEELDKLIKLEGHITYFEKTETGGRSSKPIVYLSLNNYPFKLRIANSSYRAISYQALSQLKVGKYISIWTQKKEIERSKANSPLNRLLNSLLKWRRQPLIYSISIDDKQLLTIQQYKKSELEHDNRNLKVVIIIIIFIAFFALRMYFTEKK